MPLLPAPAAPEGSQCHCHCCRLPYFWRLPHLQGLRVGSGGGKRVTVELGLLPGTASARRRCYLRFAVGLGPAARGRRLQRLLDSSQRCAGFGR